VSSVRRVRAVVLGICAACAVGCGTGGNAPSAPTHTATASRTAGVADYRAVVAAHRAELDAATRGMAGCDSVDVVTCADFATAGAFAIRDVLSGWDALADPPAPLASAVAAARSDAIAAQMVDRATCVTPEEVECRARVSEYRLAYQRFLDSLARVEAAG